MQNRSLPKTPTQTPQLPPKQFQTSTIQLSEEQRVSLFQGNFFNFQKNWQDAEKKKKLLVCLLDLFSFFSEFNLIYLLI